MTRDELLNRINETATSVGSPPVSARQLWDWRDEGLLVGAHAHGRRRGLPPDWRWSDGDLETVNEITSLRLAGARRADELAIELWFIGRPIQIGRVRRAFRSEFDRLVKRTRRKLRDTKGDAKGASRRALLNRMGPLDRDLGRLNLRPSDGLLLNSLGEAIEGAHGSPALADGLFRENGTPETLQLPSPISTLLLGMSGMLAVADESDRSALEAIENATDADFEDARHTLISALLAVKVFSMTMELIAKKEDRNRPIRILQSIFHITWKLPLFVQYLNGIYKVKLADAFEQ